MIMTGPPAAGGPSVGHHGFRPPPTPPGWRRTVTGPAPHRQPGKPDSARLAPAGAPQAPRRPAPMRYPESLRPPFQGRLRTDCRPVAGPCSRHTPNPSAWCTSYTRSVLVDARTSPPRALATALRRRWPKLPSLAPSITLRSVFLSAPERGSASRAPAGHATHLWLRNSLTCGPPERHDQARMSICRLGMAPPAPWIDHRRTCT
jgi:hypothetical protein